MTKLTLERDTIIKRVNGIEREIAILERLGKIPLVKFRGETGFDLAQLHMHHALEGVFHIAAHILSRIPGAQATEYKELARKLGEFGVVDKKFANKKLVAMAQYRNRIVHFYAEITPQELYHIIKKELGDFTIFLSAVKQLLKKPEQFGLRVE